MKYQTIRLDKSMYKADGGFSHQLECLDPSEQYKNTELEHLDAYERQLKRFDIKVSGSHSDRISKFFSSADSVALFPEYISRSVSQGAKQNNVLEQLLASSSIIDSLDYCSITTNTSPSSNNPAIEEGEQIPDATLILQEHTIRLVKRGQILSTSYEAMKHQRADVITVALAQIGNSLVGTQIQDAVNMLVKGQGTIPPAQKLTVSGSKFTYSSVLDLWNAFGDFEMNTMVASPNTIRQLMELPEFRESTAGDAFTSSGTLVTPFGATLVKSTAVKDNQLVGLDRRFALEMVSTGGIQVEYDKLIDTQLERAAVTTTYGFSKLFPEAVRVAEHA